MLGLPNYLYRLIPANPILLRVVETGGKRFRDAIIRWVYLGLLILVVLVSLYGNNGSVSDTNLAELAKTSVKVFQNLSYLQLGLVALLSPIFTAGSITQERDSQTYDILLATPLSNGQIVLGSLLSRLFFVIMLLISGIPVFAITQIFGGVKVSDIWVSFLISAATAFVTGALAMAIATFKVGTRRTIFSFYFFIVIYLVGIVFLDQQPWFHPILRVETTPGQITGTPIVSTTSWLTGLNPFTALATLFASKDSRPPVLADLPENLRYWPVSWYLTSPASFYITFMFFLSFVLVTPSVILLRWLAQTNLPFKTWILTKLKIATADRTRKPRSVWANPIAWREGKTKASATRASLLRYGFILVGLIGSLGLVYQFSSLEPVGTYIRPGSFNTTSDVLTVYDSVRAHAYQMKPDTVITIKNNPADNEGKPGSRADLARTFAVNAVDNGNNRLLTLTLWPIPRKISEDSVRNYLLAFVVLEFAVILLIVTNAAASTVTREKEDGTLDLLLTTPITSRYYIWGKLRGLVHFVLPLIAVPVASTLVFILYDAMRFAGSSEPGDRWIAFPESVILLPGMLIVISALAAITGMRMSLAMRTTVMAVMSAVGIVVGVCGVLGFCGYSLLNNKDFGPMAVFIGSFSPFTLMSMLINPYQFDHVFEGDDQSTNRITIIISTIAAVGGYTAIVFALYRSMVKNFDMTIRRQQR
jgi:ABC-type Na+ efflux pump permease subunit